MVADGKERVCKDYLQSAGATAEIMGMYRIASWSAGRFPHITIAKRRKAMRIDTRALSYL